MSQRAINWTEFKCYKDYFWFVFGRPPVRIIRDLKRLDFTDITYAMLREGQPSKICKITLELISRDSAGLDRFTLYMEDGYGCLMINMIMQEYAIALTAPFAVELCSGSVTYALKNDIPLSTSKYIDTNFAHFMALPVIKYKGYDLLDKLYEYTATNGCFEKLLDYCGSIDDSESKAMLLRLNHEHGGDKENQAPIRL